jgi:hypothetical protein
MMITLLDKKSLRITGPLLELHDEIMVCSQSRADLIPQGAIIDTQKVSVEFSHPKKGFYVVNKKDLINFRDDLVPTAGCCGADGLRLNIASINDLPLGYEHSDCYMPHCVLIPKENVVAKVSGTQGSPIFLFAVSELNKRPLLIERMIANKIDEAYRLDAVAREKISMMEEDEEIKNRLLEKIRIAELKQIEYLLARYEDHTQLWDIAWAKHA